MNPLASWIEEQRSAYLYRACAKAESSESRAGMFARLAGEAEAQGAIWRAQLTARGHPPPPPYVPDTRTRLVARMVRWLGPRRMKPVLAAMKVRGMSVYSVAAAADDTHAAPLAGADLEHRHRNLGGGGNLRAAVFGVNDGLVSNASLILGVAGASSDARLVLVSGVAGLAAGAFAMAAGEYVSVRSQRELFEYQIGLERDELKQYPEAEAQELALIYTAKGLPQKEANRLAKQIVADPEHALDTLAREELGLNPADLGSPIGAAVSSFLAFGLGAAIPLLPFALASASNAMLITRDNHRACTVRHRCHAFAVYRAQRGVLGLADAGARRACGRRHLRHRPPVRRRRGLTHPLRAALSGRATGAKKQGRNERTRCGLVSLGRMDRRSPGRDRKNVRRQLAFMHSLCALARASLSKPAVFLLHMAILLSALTGCAFRQLDMNALRSSPFMSAAFELQAFIFSCCGLSAANAGPAITKPAIISANSDFIVPLRK